MDVTEERVEERTGRKGEMLRLYLCTFRLLVSLDAFVPSSAENGRFRRACNKDDSLH